MKTETIEFLKQAEKDINELQRERRNLIKYEIELEDAHDIENDVEREFAINRLETEHYQCSNYIEYLEKKIASSFTSKIAEDLINSLDPETIQQHQKFETALFDDEKVSIN